MGSPAQKCFPPNPFQFHFSSPFFAGWFVSSSSCSWVAKGGWIQQPCKKILYCTLAPLISWKSQKHSLLLLHFLFQTKKSPLPHLLSPCLLVTYHLLPSAFQPNQELAPVPREATTTHPFSHCGQNPGSSGILCSCCIPVLRCAKCKKILLHGYLGLSSPTFMEGFPAHFLRCSQDAHAALATRPSHSAMFGDIAHIVALLTLDHWTCPFTTEGLSSPNYSWLSSQTTVGFPAKLLLAFQPNYSWLSSQTTFGFPAKPLNAAQTALDHDPVKIFLLLIHLLPEAHWCLPPVVQLIWLPQGNFHCFFKNQKNIDDLTYLIKSPKLQKYMKAS